MTTQAQAYKLLRDFLKTPDDAALRREALRYLAHAALGELRQQKRALDEGVGDRDQCPRCWGTTFDEIGRDDVPCRRCIQPDGKSVGTIPRP